MDSDLECFLETFFSKYMNACEVVYSGSEYLASKIKELNQRGHSMHFNKIDHFNNHSKNFHKIHFVNSNTFPDLCLVQNAQEAEESCKRKASHILVTHGDIPPERLFEYQCVQETKSQKHQERQNCLVRCAIVRAIFSSQGRLCDSVDVSKDPDMPSFLFTDRPDLISPEVKSKTQVICMPNRFGKAQLASKHVKWVSHFYLPTQDILLWVDAFMAPDSKFDWTFYMQGILKLSEKQNNIQTFCVSLRKQFFSRLNAYSENDECLRCKRISRDMQKEADSYLANKNISRTEAMQIYWTSIVVKANRHAQTAKLGEELFSILQEVHYRDQVFLPLVLHEHQTSVLSILPEKCDKVLGNHNVEVKP